MSALSGVAWSSSSSGRSRRLPRRLAHPITREWAWDGSTGRGVRICVVDTGIETDHPLVGRVDGAVVVEEGGDELRICPDEQGDAAGHGTACGGIIRSIAPDCALYSCRVLGSDSTGTASAFVAGLEWAVEQRFDIISVSMSTRRRDVADALRIAADDAYFQKTVVVCSAHNMAVQSFPWQFASVISVGAHEGEDPLELHYNARPPVEFFARGMDVEVAWVGGGTSVTTGNSFAAAHVSGLCARILAKHPGLSPFELKTVLYATAANVETAA